MRISDWSSDVCSSDLLGTGAVEVGTVTPRPQAGNPRPRLFRLPDDHAVINRNGFNNDGLDAAAARLARRDRATGIVGINIGANKDRSEEHTSELQSLMRISYAVFCLKKKKKQKNVT